MKDACLSRRQALIRDGWKEVRFDEDAD